MKWPLVLPRSSKDQLSPSRDSRRFFSPRDSQGQAMAISDLALGDCRPKVTEVEASKCNVCPAKLRHKGPEAARLRSSSWPKPSSLALKSLSPLDAARAR